MNLDANRIYGTIFQGSKPPKGHRVSSNGFHVLVLSAEEYQPESSYFPGVTRVVHAPIDDAEPTRKELGIANRAAGYVAQAASNGLNVLVTCQAGLNRSGLIVALSIYFMTKQSGKKIVRLIKSKREGSLTNPWFVEIIEKLPALK